MSTRATIIVEGIDYCQLYKHHDGYPSGTLPWLQDFNAGFTKDRGDDPTYKMAQLIRDSFRSKDKYCLDSSISTGWGVYPYKQDVGQEYEYTLHRDGTVTYNREGQIQLRSDTMQDALAKAK